MQHCDRIFMLLIILYFIECLSWLYYVFGLYPVFLCCLDFINTLDITKSNPTLPSQIHYVFLIDSVMPSLILLFNTWLSPESSQVVVRLSDTCSIILRLLSSLCYVKEYWPMFEQYVVQSHKWLELAYEEVR